MSDLNMKYEYVERKHPKLFVGIHQLCWHHNNSSADKLVEYIFDIEQQLQQAHRQGWEQCQREAEKACRNRAAEYWDHEAGALGCADAIASMGYKGSVKTV